MQRSQARLPTKRRPMNELKQHTRTTIHATMRLTAWLLLLLAGVYAISGVYSVEPGEIAVHTRFGEILDNNVMPGIHVGLPQPFDQVFKVPVKRMRTIRIDDFADQTQAQEKENEFSQLTGITTYCLTGDNNIVTIACVIQYSIQDAAQYLFSSKSPEEMLSRLARNAVIHCLSNMPVDAILTTAKTDIAELVKTWINRRLGALDCGLKVQFLELKSVAPPRLVQENFRDVVKAEIDRKKMLNDSEGFRSQRLSAAKAEAVQIYQEGIAYKNDVIAKANGLTSRFLKKLSEFERNPKLVRQKEYFDFFQALGKKWPKKIIMTTKNGKAPVRLRLSWPK